MPIFVSPSAQVSPDAKLGDDVYVGPFCLVGPQVTLGMGCRLESHVAILGKVHAGERNRFFPGAVVGGEPQDLGYTGAATSVEIGDENIFREGVTVNRGAQKEDGITRVGHRNFLMANAHVAHNCHVFNNTILCNGSLLGGHVHVHDFAIISGNSVVHHFATVGTGAFLSGGCRCPTDLPPYMLAAGSDNPEIITVNLVGMRRRGISEETIGLIRAAFKLLFRSHKPVAEVRRHFTETVGAELPSELEHLLSFVEASGHGKNGRAREAVRLKPAEQNRTDSERKAA